MNAIVNQDENIATMVEITATFHHVSSAEHDYVLKFKHPKRYFPGQDDEKQWMVDWLAVVHASIRSMNNIMKVPDDWILTDVVYDADEDEEIVIARPVMSHKGKLILTHAQRAAFLANAQYVYNASPTGSFNEDYAKEAKKFLHDDNVIIKD